MLKEILSIAIAAALIAGAAPPVAAGPLCLHSGIETGLVPHRDSLRPRVDGLEPRARRAPIEVTRTEPDGSRSVVYIDPRSLAPVLPGMPDCVAVP